jgi:hypothetical protein
VEMPKLGDAHRKMEKIAGSWVGEERIYPSPWDQEGGLATGRAVNRIALDGFALVQDYEQERKGAVSFRGHGILTWDAAQSCYAFHWFDSMGMPPGVYRGNFEGDTLTMTYKMPQGYSRALWSFPDDKHYTFRMEVSGDGKQWQPFMEGKYARKA